MAEVIIVLLLLLVLLAEVFSRPRAPRSGVHIIRGEMDPNYEPPSMSLQPRTTVPPPPPLAYGIHQRPCPECTSAPADTKEGS